MSPPTDNIPSPRKRADFPQVFRHERTLANRLRETNHGSTAPPPERCPRQEPLGRNGPPAFTLCHRAGGPFRAPFGFRARGNERGHPHFLGTGEWVAPSNPWYRRVGGPIQSPGHSQDGPSNHAPTRSVCTAAAVASLRARFSHSCGINVSLASLGRYARTCERYHGLFSPGSRPTGSSQTLSASPTGLRARWACGLMVLGATKC